MPMLEMASAAMSLTRSARWRFDGVSTPDQAARTGSLTVPPRLLRHRSQSGGKHSIEPRRCDPPTRSAVLFPHREGGFRAREPR
ncbi:hypothetical protein GCM10009662_22500 [Catellatospora coxensis]|uniref:Uncharacterized protein n=1 Tax=Catellatospora coxensis TaxID=310354 RepID=A0A8J3KPZ2_9ACTN|nr:hypothetical protein Cco03nite_08380 [Catellatospora coxensis]